MIRAWLTILGAVVGFIQGMAFFLIGAFSFDAPFAVLESGELVDYPILLFGGIGALCGAVLGWAAHAWMKKPRVWTSGPARVSKPGDPPFQGPFAR